MLSSVRRFFTHLPAWAVGLIALTGVALVAGGAYAGYRTYDYIEHDNEFCLSCHLMVDPFERFARSAHRDLGCKACHKPTFVARSTMALTQILENPDTLQAHAEVPNEKCTSCHIDGDPEKWENIASSAGHRIHFESEDASLQGLNCVECHSSSVHGFTPATETCSQSGCHTDSGIQLGGMGDLTIHCTACHQFNAPVPREGGAEVLAAAVSPDAAECLSCHVMRTLVDMPDDEPHEAACGLCHQPHEQTTPEQAVESCATVGCHSQPDTLTPFHRGMGPGVLSDCTACHDAHDWRVNGENCLTCHQEIVTGPASGRTAGTAGTASTASTASKARPAVVSGAVRTDPHAPGRAAALAAGLIHAPVAGTGRTAARSSGPSADAEPDPVGFAGLRASGGAGPAGPGKAAASPEPLPQLSDTVFTHARHRNVSCLSCHATDESHGRITVTGISDCRSCHHTRPVSANCSSCHQPSERPADAYRVTRSLTFSVRSTAVRRELPFDHDDHGTVACARCHTEGLALSAAQVDCASCHEEHHDLAVECASCHAEAPASAHPQEEVHVGCAGSGCHEEVPVEGIPGTRSFCMVCHQNMGDHRPRQSCAECHQVPGSRPAGGAP